MNVNSLSWNRKITFFDLNTQLVVPYKYIIYTEETVKSGYSWYLFYESPHLTRFRYQSSSLGFRSIESFTMYS